MAIVRSVGPRDPQIRLGRKVKNDVLGGSNELIRVFLASRNN